jgi:hypothetical protein
VERKIEIFLAISTYVIGASHLFRSDDWAAAYGRLHDLGRPAAFINGGLHLAAGAAIIAALQTLAWPDIVLTVFGCLLVVKGTVCFLAPDLALKSMRHGAEHPRGFKFGGLLLIAVGAWASYCAWQHSHSQAL